MLHEHCNAHDSATRFTTPNYGISTTSEIEWWFVVNPIAGRRRLGFEHYPAETTGLAQSCARGRTQLKPPSLFADEIGRVSSELRKGGHSPLQEEEFISARLYTGPLFTKYNAVLRGVGRGAAPSLIEAREQLCGDNRYTTTLHCINSAVIKLSKLSCVQKVTTHLS